MMDSAGPSRMSGGRTRGQSLTYHRLDPRVVHHEGVSRVHQGDRVLILELRFPDCYDPVVELLPERTPAPPGAGGAGDAGIRDLGRRQPVVERGIAEVH